MSCCVIDSLVDNNLLEQLALTGADYQNGVVSARQPDVHFAHFLWENLPSFRSRFARQVCDVFNGRRDVLSKPPPDPASGCLPACRGWWAISQRVSDGGLTGRVTILGGNGNDAFRFWATCSTGTSMVTGGSTGAVGERVDPDFYDRG